MIAGHLAEWFGRKKMIVVSALLFLLSIPVICASGYFEGGNFWMMVAGRAMQGAAAGLFGVIVPMYLAECLDADSRGKGTGMFQLLLTIGLVFVAVIGFAVTSVVGDSVKVVAEKAAAAGVAASRGGSLLQRRYVVPFLLAVLVLTLNKTMGMSSFTSYLVTILQESGFEGMFANWGQFAVKLTNMVVTIAAAALVDKKGRIWLLKVGTGGMTLGLMAIGGVFLAIEHFGVQANNFTGLITMCSFLFMQTFYALGPGICVWLVLSELMPSRIRANGMAFALLMNQFVAWGLASTLHPWKEAWGWSSMFFFFAVNGLLYFFVVHFIPETKGRSLDELEHLFDKKS
jgi:MFS family permease